MTFPTTLDLSRYHLNLEAMECGQCPCWDVACRLWDWRLCGLVGYLENESGHIGTYTLIDPQVHSGIAKTLNNDAQAEH